MYSQDVREPPAETNAQHGIILALCVVFSALVAALPPLRPLDASGRVTYVVDEGSAESGFVSGDRRLASWAFSAWQRALDNTLRFEPAARSTALVQLFWVPAAIGEFGETQPLLVHGHAGAAVYIRPDTSALGPDIARRARQDPLFRDTVVYLTCVHELGHALGLPHTSSFADIMYAFGYGGDIPEFFMRYRRQLATRADIARVAGLSPADITAVRSLYPR